MLENLDRQIRDAYQHAAECAARAKAATRSDEREDWLVLERRYLVLARSIDFRFRLERFTDEVQRHIRR